jgi:hypothetical protein
LSPQAAQQAAITQQMHLIQMQMAQAQQQMAQSQQMGSMPPRGDAHSEPSNGDAQASDNQQ